MSIVLDGTSGITTPEIVSTGGPLVVNASAPDNSVVVDASGNVGIGTSSPSGKLHVNGVGLGTAMARFVGNDQGNLRLRFENIGSGGRTWEIVGGLPGANNSNLSIQDVTGNTTPMTIDSSGNLLVGTTSKITTSGLSPLLNVSSSQNAAFFRTTSTDGFSVLSVQVGVNGSAAAAFFNSAGGVPGTITVNATTTSYNTTSDYRLKENIVPMTGALAKVAALKPVTYRWKSTGEADEGFIAHELQEVCPSAVSGEKDAVETYTDEDGVEQTRIKPQGIDTSFLVATLTAALQELKAINDAQAQTIESLTARVVALEQA